MRKIVVSGFRAFNVGTVFDIGPTTVLSVSDAQLSQIGSLLKVAPGSGNGPSVPAGFTSTEVCIGAPAMSQTAAILKIRDDLAKAKGFKDKSGPFLDLLSIVCAGVPGLGVGGALVDKLAARMGPDVENGLIELSHLTALLSKELSSIRENETRIGSTLDVLQQNKALTDKLLAQVEAMTEPEARIASTNGGQQTFRDVVFARLRLSVSATSGGHNHLDGVQQYGAGAEFTADGGDNVVERSRFAHGPTTVQVQKAHIRSAQMNTGNVGMHVTLGQGHTVGLMVGGDGVGAAVWIPIAASPKSPGSK